ncbi:MAG TPA: thioredoxin-like domain-containing protein [Bacteroidales bacterium]|jgi:thiol-disulfide isomerase/thioredoxin|nr:thioredoxin-like domain-containing protein [Bacteroidales bacterium]
MMKKKLVILPLIFLISIPVIAQGKIPPFRMIRWDGTMFSATQLPMGKPVMIYYFSPECEECQKFTGELLSKINDFSNVSIAMITYQSTQTVADYVKKNHLRSYANIYVGTEGSSLFVRNYYNILHFPFVALYTKEGKLIRTYTWKEVSVEDMIFRLKNIK